MPKYRRQETAEELEDNVLEVNEELDNEDNDNQAELNAEAETWKKRHGDLRRHAQTKEQEFNQRIAELEDKVKEVSKDPTDTKPPASTEELEEWMEKYPVVAKMIDSIALKRVTDADEVYAKKFQKTEELDFKIALKEQKILLNDFQPEFFNKIDVSTEFKEWLEEKAPSWAKEALFPGKGVMPDASKASDAIDLYKIRTGYNSSVQEDVKENAQDDRKAAAGTKVPTNSSKPKGKKGIKFSESQVERMTQRDYEKNEDAIAEAMENGEFEYDLSGV